MANRPQRRQGVVYGPARPSPGSGGGAILGRILGLFILVMAVVLLGVGVVNFFGERSASPSRPPTAFAQVSPTPSFAGLPTAPQASQTPPVASASPTPSGSSGPLVTPTPSPPLIQVGPGFVTFGTRADSELRIRDPRTSFVADERITWSAHLINPTNAAEVRMLVVKEDPIVSGGERLIADEEVSPAVVGEVFVRRIRPTRFLDGPGFYTVRYVRGDRLLAEGYFVVTD